MAEENRPSICSFLFQNHFLYPNFEMFFNYLPLTNEQMGGSEAQKCCASVGLSSGLIWFLFFNLVSARPVLSVMVSPVEFVFVCAGLWLLCCSCFGGVSPVQLVLVFVVVVDGFWFRFVSVRPVFSLFWIVCYLYQWSSYLQPSKLNYYCAGAIITFNFPFEVNVVFQYCRYYDQY